MPIPFPHSFAALARRAALAALCGAGCVAQAWFPGPADPSVAAGFTVNRTDRRDVLAFHHSVYAASEGYAARMAWTGSLTTGSAGTTSAAFKEDVRRRINYYRVLAGLPGDITFNPTKSAKCQETSLMSARNNALSHTPPTSWIFYTANAAAAAGNANLTLGYYGPGGIDAYVRDDGANNALVGHRRWLFYSRAREMGTGDVPPVGPYRPSNTTWVIGDHKAPPAPAAIAWPSAGYFPLPLVSARWSLGYPGANFASATVTMTRAGSPVATTVISRTDNGYGDNTLVWLPASLPVSIANDTVHTVTVSGITGSGVPATITYTVTLFDPEVLGESVNLAGSPTPPASGAPYGFNPIAQADGYQATVSTASTTPWAEGAETSPAPRVIDQTSASYPLTQTDVKRSGSRGFHIAFNTFEEADQGFEIDRELVPTAASALIFHDRFRFTTTANRLSAEVSENGGPWAEIWGRNGLFAGDASSSGWDAAFLPRSVSLAAFAGKSIRIRFVFRHNNLAFTGVDSSFGVFLDDITVTSATELVNTVTTAIPAAATDWTLNASTAGAALQAGTRYLLRMRPSVGRKWFPYGPTLEVVPRAPNGFESWVAARYPGLTGGLEGNPDGDALPNLVEYAFDANPLQFAPSPPATRATVTPAGFGTAFPTPQGVSGVLYSAEWSADLVSWFPVTDSGAGGSHAFWLPVTGVDRRFFRLVVRLSP